MTASCTESLLQNQCYCSLRIHKSPALIVGMDEDVIVVDDIENDAGPSTSNGGTDAIPAESFYATPSLEGRGLRLRSGSSMTAQDTSERTTRSSNQRSKAQPKLKLKLSDKAASQAPGMSFLGAYDRELDSDEDDLAFEEQFILRMPPGEDCEKLRKAIASREVGTDVWFKFKGVALNTSLLYQLIIY
jgi:transcription initiation factor TFIID subunit 7